MHLFLLTTTKLYNFALPQEVFGNYNFALDDDDSDDNIINIEAKDKKWYLYSTKKVMILDNNNPVESVALEHNKMYNLRTSDNIYIIYIRDDSLNNCYYYQFEKLNMLIGNRQDSNIKISQVFNIEANLKIFSDENNRIYIEPNGALCYINENIATNTTTPLIAGDKIWAYGLEIIILNNRLVINSPYTEDSSINPMTANLTKVYVDYNKDYTVEEMSDLKLYSKEDYFIKSPKIRRSYNKKTLNIEERPKKNDDQELPLILTIGPMMTMGMTSFVMLAQTLSQLYLGDTVISKAWPSLVTSVVMMVSVLAWPLITSFYNRKRNDFKYKRDCRKYYEYLKEIEKTLNEEVATQKNILIETLKTTGECLEIISNKNMEFWNKNNNEKDFLEVRIGIADKPLDIEIINENKDDYKTENSAQKEMVDNILEKYKYIKDAPISYSLREKYITAIMGYDKKLNNTFINNLLIQLLACSNYEDLKIVLFTKQKDIKQWEYLKYLNHSFDNEKTIRYIGTDKTTTERICSVLLDELNNRLPKEDESANKLITNNDDIEKPEELKTYKPYYLIICDDYDMIKETEFMRVLNSSQENLGFSLIISERRLSNLPSNCNNYMYLSEDKVSVVKNNYNQQDFIDAKLEILNNIDYMAYAKVLANIPIEFDSKVGSLPNAISFLEMEKVGKVEQLNILNRWKNSDPINSLKAEIGVDNKNELMYLDLHEKYHGPHGLIAGTTGSGKSEFIITYILSMCINYSPDYVSFILIDYKGGGLALAFENKLTGVVLPHLAGTITNLDKAEMNRTLVSIDSESKRRQQLFNEARDKLGESTMDIYKYQKHYKDGNVTEPIPHLFIICDEFAELKSQQPEFMDNLISVARIGRSLGVHLILATQKPSGVVNDQIWSNTKFRVCLKVQDESDSQEMLKHKDAAYITKSGRYYLQVGYDEIYELGQSGWCGAKYYPSDEIKKEIDNSVDFINSSGDIIRSIEEATSITTESQGEQLAAIMNNIIETAKHDNKSSRKLWLPNIPEIITFNYLLKKYNFQRTKYNLSIPIGEYDAPELQEQGLVEYNFIDNGNTIIYSMNNSDYEMLIEAMIVSTITLYSSSEINIYGFDRGSEFTKKYLKDPHVGGFVYAGDSEKYNNLIKYIKEEITRRKELFADYGGDYKNYLKAGKTDCPFMLIIINNYDTLYEENQDLYDILPEISRDSVRYGIGYVVSCTATNSVGARSSQNFANFYMFKVKDQYDYGTILNSKKKLIPRDNKGRGMLNNGEMHEFQVLSLTENEDNYNEYVQKLLEAVINRDKVKAPSIPTLPKIVSRDFINEAKSTLDRFPLGLTKNSIKTLYYNFIEYGNIILLTKKLKNIKNFVLSFIDNIKEIENSTYEIIDFTGSLEIENETIVKEEYDDYVTKLIEKYTNEEINNPHIIILYGVSDSASKMGDSEQLGTLGEAINKNANSYIVCIDNPSKMGDFMYSNAYKIILDNAPGLYIGKGISEQNILKPSSYSKELDMPINNNYAFFVQDGDYILIKLIDYYTKDDVDE